MNKELKIPRFPVMLRRMWSGHEVQAWIDENFAEVVSKAKLYEHMLAVARANGFNSITEAIPLAVKQNANKKTVDDGGGD